jgi:hypothetical protein
MNNDFTARGDLGNGRPERDRRGASPDAPLTDREVPLGLARTPVAVHQWLDGDLPESTVRQGEMVRHVEFWNRVGAQAEARRQMRTPEYLTAQIMQALPQGTPTVSTRWWQRRVELSPMLLAAVGASVLALGVVVGTQLAR